MNKQEQEQMKSLGRQLNRLADSTDNLYRRMAINGRDRIHVELARSTAINLEMLANKVNTVIVDD